MTVSSEDPGIGLIDLIRIFWSEKWIVLGVPFLFAVASIIYALLLTPIFRAEVVLAPISAERSGSGMSGLSGLASLAGISIGTSGDSNQSIAILSSRGIAEEFIRVNNLLPILVEELPGGTAASSGDGDSEQPDIRDGVREFIENVRFVTQDRETGLITLAIELPDPAMAARWATDLVELVNDRIRQRDIRESEEKLEFLYEQLESAALVELRQAISRVIEDQINAMMLARSQPEYAFKVIDPASEPKERSSPRRALIVIVGTLLGGVLAVILAFANYARKQIVVSAEPKRRS